MDTLGERTAIRETADIRAAGNTSAVSWGAIIAGAVAASALSLVLFILGIGLGLTSVSPWSTEGIGATALGVSAILWISFTSFMASGLGGYLTGRLRTKWVTLHTDEVFFRDTAHGFLAWGLATLLTAMLFSSVTVSAVSNTVQAGATVAGGIADTAVSATAAGAAGAAGGAAEGADDQNGPMAYFLDSLFRRDLAATPAPQQQQQPQQQAAPAPQGEQPAGGEQPETPGEDQPDGNAITQEGNAVDTTPNLQRQAMPEIDEPVPPQAVAEIGRIFVRGMQMESLPQEDLTYAGQLVARYTDISATEAEQRVRETFDTFRTEMRELETSARETADQARIATASVSLWFFVALMIGAFIGSYAATLGGRQRDL